MEESVEKLELVMDYLTPAMKEKAQKELNETEEIKTKALNEFKELIKNEKNLVCPTDDAFLIRFLRARKYNVERTLEIFQKYWRLIHKLESTLHSVSADRIIETMLRNFFGLLFYRDKTGCTVLVFNIGRWNPQVDNIDQIIALLKGCLNYCVQFPATQVCGFRAIIDARELTWRQVKMFTPYNVWLLIYATQSCIPGRYKGIHILTKHKLFKVIWAVVYPLLTSKLKSRVTIHENDTEPLKEFVHPSILPTELGGEAGPMDMSAWSETLGRDLKPTVLSLYEYGYTK